MLSFNSIIFLIFFLNLITQYYWGYTCGGIDFHTITHASEGMSHTLNWVLLLLLALFFFCFPKKILWTCARSHGTHILAFLFLSNFSAILRCFLFHSCLVLHTIVSWRVKKYSKEQILMKNSISKFGIPLNRGKSVPYCTLQ